jgi:hypothetical protein
MSICASTITPFNDKTKTVQCMHTQWHVGHHEQGYADGMSFSWPNEDDPESVSAFAADDEDELQ